MTEQETVDMTPEAFMAKLVKLQACSEAREFVSGKSLRESWESCINPSWMLWLLGRSAINKKVIATIAVEFAEMCVHNAKDYPAVAECIAVTKRYLAGNATAEELSAAESAAWSAAMSAARSAVRSAAESAAESAAWSAAAAVRSAAESTAESAESAAWSAAESAAWSVQCDIIRKHVPADEIVKLFV